MMDYVIILNDAYDGFSPVTFGFENCSKSHSYGPAIRTHWLIHFVVSGCGILKIYDKEYSVEPGSMFVVPPYVEMYYEADKENPWSYIWIGFTSDRKLPCKLTNVIHCPRALRVFISMKEVEHFETGRSAFLISKIWELFAVLLEDEKHSPTYVDQALDCIHSKYMYNLSIKEIATQLGLDHSYFSALFRKKMGISPKQYLLNYRMDKAVSFMLEHGVNVSVTANSVGTQMFIVSPKCLNDTSDPRHVNI